MRAFIVACCLLVSASAAFTPAVHLRSRRDVSEVAAPAYEYLPPQPKLQPDLEEPETTTATPTTLAPEPSVRVGPSGYEYRTVRRLRYRARRQRRDVSHLSAHYLPPAASTAATPQNDYLPPAAVPAPAAEEPAAPATVDDTEEVVAAIAPKVANDYLPPLKEIAVVTEPIDVPAEAETEAPAPDADELRVDDTPEQDSAILADDGYHYKQPAEGTQLKEAPPAPVAAEEYLPPLTDDTVAVEGPEESAVLASDGYHYRAIRRLRF